jgi:hypothetical protein
VRRAAFQASSPIALAAMLAALPAPARGDDAPRDPPTFWDRLLAPHAREVGAVLAVVARAREGKEGYRFEPYGSSGLWSRAHQIARRQLAADLEGMLRYALGLAPGDREVARALALVLADAGRPDAEAALTAYLADPTPPLGEAQLALGRLLARRGDEAGASRVLRAALAADALDARGRSTATLLLAQLHMLEGRVGAAINLLEPEARGAGPLDLALAVAYDRDEQLSRSRAVLDRITAVGPEALVTVLGEPLLDFVRPGERLYWSALVLETIGLDADAQVEWTNYAALPDIRFAERARGHARRLAASLAEPRATPEKEKPPGPRAR